jgi:alkylation response protein AidB-like acyl-CoA dehydrogenase
MARPWRACSIRQIERQGGEGATLTPTDEVIPASAPDNSRMNLALTDDQVMIRDSAESFLADVSDSAAVRALAATDAGFDEAVWRRVATELGWCGTTIPESLGGLGLSPVELTLILEQCGRRLLCAPLFSTVCLGANLLQHAGSDAARERYLPRIAAGELIVSTPLPASSDDWTRSAVTLRATRRGDRWALDGACVRVPDAHAADVLFLLAEVDSGGIGLFAVGAGATGVGVTIREGWDATRRFGDVDLDDVVADLRLDDPERAGEGLARSAALARLYIAAEQLGGAQQCLDLTVAYLATRKQFGRTLNSFQALKHRCAEMMVRVEALRSAVYGAAAVAASGGASLELECAMARALAGDTLFACAAEAIQLHGGVGFTWEYDPQLYFKRAQASSHWLGTAPALRARIADSLLGVAA